MQRTTVMIDDALLREAIKAIGAKTKKEAIEAGLRALIRLHNREAFRKELGSYDLDLDLEALEAMRNDD